MRADQLTFEDLIDLNPSTGEIYFNEKRMSLVSTEALGLLRHDLLDTLGMERTQSFLKRYGWTWGKRDGQELTSMYEWENKEELLLAGPRVHTLLGVVKASANELKIEGDSLYYSGSWENSFEAKEHINHHGESDDNGCWTLVGYASGFLTEVFGQDVIVKETKCLGRGDTQCSFEAKTLDENDIRANKMMEYYKADSIADELEEAQREISIINQNIIKSNQIHQQLTDLLVEGKSLEDTIYFLTKIINKSVVIDYYNNIIESAFIKEKDKEIYNNWTEKYLYEEEQKNHIRTFPIRTNNVNLGRLVIVSEDEITSLDELIIERALSIFMVQMYYQWKITHSLWEKKENFFQALLNDINVDKEQFEQNAHLFNFHPSQLNRILSINILSQLNNQEVMEFLEVHALLKEKDFFISDNKIIIILSEKIAEHPIGFVRELLKSLNNEFSNSKFHLGLGRMAKNIRDLRESYQDANAISAFISLTNPTESMLATYEKMGSIMMLIKGSDQHELIDFYKRTIGEIIKYDEQNDSDYLLTLKTYLDLNGNLQQTADKLHLSVAGLRYRIERIESLAQLNLKTGDARFNCQLAIQIHFSIALK